MRFELIIELKKNSNRHPYSKVLMFKKFWELQPSPTLESKHIYEILRTLTVTHVLK